MRIKEQGHAQSAGSPPPCTLSAGGAGPVWCGGSRVPQPEQHPAGRHPPGHHDAGYEWIRGVGKCGKCEGERGRHIMMPDMNGYEVWGSVGVWGGVRVGGRPPPRHYDSGYKRIRGVGKCGVFGRGKVWGMSFTLV